MEPLSLVLISVITTLLASSGFWSYIIHKSKTNDSVTLLIMGLAYDKIMYLGTKYVARGYVTREEYEDLRKYFYGPYSTLGGNGTAEWMMNQVSNLPIRSSGGMN